MDEVLRLALLVWLASASTAFANERSQELVDSFTSFCTPGPPDFAALDAKATAMNLPVRKDVTPGPSAHTKSWLITLKSGKHELIAGEAHGANGDLAGCSIGAEDVDGEEMKKNLVQSMKLVEPARQSVTADGTQRVTSWKYADDVILTLADGTPMKIPGMLLTLMRQTKTSH
jgi:hypothetical protein